MKRAAIFAHYDKDKIIDDYVIYYLKELKKITQNLVFVSCCDISDSEKLKLNGIADFVIAEKHNEYDFGSYKRGYLYLKEFLNDYDELIFANDSCFGPLFPLQNVFDDVEKSMKCDFWGITKNKFGMEKRKNKYVTVKRPHLQSYFVVFNKNVFQSEVFDNFMESIKHFDEKNDIILNYEIGLTEILSKQGFSYDSYIKSYYRLNHVLISFWRELIEKCRIPFVKCSVLRLANEDLTTICDWEKTIGRFTDYPVELIENNLKRTMCRNFSDSSTPNWVKRMFFNLMSIQPACLKKCFAIILKRYLSFLCD